MELYNVALASIVLTLELAEIAHLSCPGHPNLLYLIGIT
jgi:hypothetical protein